MELLNKSKKIIDKIENINQIKSLNLENGIYNKNVKNNKKNLSKKIKVKEEIKKNKKPRTLWIRKKRAS